MTNWREQAACRGADPRLFDPIDGDERNRRSGHPTGHPRILQAFAVCRGCPVRELCDQEAVAEGRVGVWGARYHKQQPTGMSSTPARPVPEKKPEPRPRTGRRPSETATDARWLADAGISTHGIAARLGLTEPYVRKLLGRNEVVA